MVRDANRVLRGSAAPRSFGAPKKWNAAAAAVEANSRRAQKSGEDNASLDGDGTRNEEEEHAKRPAKEKCNHPEEARTDERYKEGDAICPVCGGALPAAITFETAASRHKTQMARGMDGVTAWKPAERGHLWERQGLHVSHGRATVLQRPEQVEVQHAETNPQVQYERGVGLEIAAGRKGRPKADRDADLAKAAGWFRAAAFQGHSKATLKIAICHLTGRGAPYLPDQGMRFLERCAEVEPDGAFELAISYKEGRGIEKDTSKAENWFRFAADLGHIGAQQVMANTNTESSDGLRAQLEAFQRKARRGDAEALYQVANHYMDGHLVSRNEGTACKMYHQAALQGHPAAMTCYALCCMHGRGTKISMEDGIDWLETASRADHGVAQLELATILEEGDALPQDLPRARSLRLKASSWDDRNVVVNSLKAGKPVGGVVSARASDMAPYLDFCAKRMDDYVQRLAARILAQYLLSSLMVWRRRRPNDKRPLVVPQEEWRSRRKGMADLEADIDSRLEQMCLLLGTDVRPILLHEARLLQSDVCQMQAIVRHTMVASGSEGRLKTAVHKVMEGLRTENGPGGGGRSMAEITLQQQEEGMLHLAWDRDQVEDPSEILDVDDVVEFVVRFDRSTEKLCAVLLTKCWGASDTRPGTILVLPKTADEATMGDQRRSAAIGEVIRQIKDDLQDLAGHAARSKTFEERLEHRMRVSVLEREQAMLETEQGGETSWPEGAFAMLVQNACKDYLTHGIVSKRTAEGTGRPWWSNLWGDGLNGQGMAHKIYDRDDILLADEKFRDSGLGRIRGVVSELSEGDADAQFELGYRYITGKGVTRNERRGVWWLEKSSGQAQKLAQCALGICCHLGVGMARSDEERARNLLTISAEQGVPLARAYLASLVASSSSYSALGAASLLDSLRSAYSSSKNQTASRHQVSHMLGSLYSGLPNPGIFSHPAGATAVRRDADLAVGYFGEGADGTLKMAAFPPSLGDLGEIAEYGGEGRRGDAYGFYARAARAAKDGHRGVDARAEQDMRWMPAHMDDVVKHGMGTKGREGQGWGKYVSSVGEKMERLVGDSMKF